MTGLPDMAGTPRIVEIKGKEYRMSPLDIDDLAEFETVATIQRNKALFESIKSSGLEDTLIAEAIGATASRPISLNDITKYMWTMTGVRFLLWRTLRKNHPQMKQEDAAKLVDFENLEQISKQLMELGGKAAKKAKNARRGPRR
ncbi:MAG: hypothetical protein HWN68_05985 [Desulfobacterales bacterium]|nr:hypothetical protein [Desulfobacterales bacterium]